MEHIDTDDRSAVVLTVITVMSTEFCNVTLLKHAGDAEMPYVVLQGGQVDGNSDPFGHVGHAQHTTLRSSVCSGGSAETHVFCACVHVVTFNNMHPCTRSR